ncbi:MAG: hypothetical protein M1831_001687 [Alyxoria varia]|nr:MAG: hypothetical protein M1831_001687 [Alyxoria varia]
MAENRIHLPVNDAMELQPLPRGGDGNLDDDSGPAMGKGKDTHHEDIPSPGDEEDSMSKTRSSRRRKVDESPYTIAEERVIRRKLDRHVVLFMSFLYLLSFLDRSNIGNAKIAGMMYDLRLSDSQFEWLLTAFYITYILFEWMIMLYQYLRPHVYISICVLSWGLIASLQSVTTTFSGMLVLRALLGVAEAAFSPGVPFYLSFFYRREELALRAGTLISAAPLASSFAGSLAWVITKWGEDGPLAKWRLLFLVEGFPSVLVAVIAWNVVPDGPEKATFLTSRERRIAKNRLRVDAEDKQSNVARDHVESAPINGIAQPLQQKKKTVDWAQIFSTIKDPKCYLTAFMFLNCNIAFSSMPVFLPTVVNEMGHSALTSQALSAPPFLISFLTVLLTARLSDRVRSRSSFILAHSLLAATSYILLSIGGRMVERPVGQVPASAAFPIPTPTPTTLASTSLIGTTSLPISGTLVPVGMREGADGRIEAVPIEGIDVEIPPDLFPGNAGELALLRSATITVTETSSTANATSTSTSRIAEHITTHEAVGANAPWTHSRATAAPLPDSLPIDEDTGKPIFHDFQHVDPKQPHLHKGGIAQAFDPETGKPIKVLTTFFSPWTRYLLIFPACAGFFSSITLIITWTLNNQESGTGKGAGMMVLNLVGQCGPLLGVRLFPDEEGPGFARGMGVCGVAMLGVAVLVGGLRWWLVRENRRGAGLFANANAAVVPVGDGGNGKGEDKGKGKGVYEPVGGRELQETFDDDDDDGVVDADEDETGDRYHDATAGLDAADAVAAAPSPAHEDARFIYML